MAKTLYSVLMLHNCFSLVFKHMVFRHNQLLITFSRGLETRREKNEEEEI